MTTTPTEWHQPALIPVHWPLISLETAWNIPADGSPTMVAWSVRGQSSGTTLLSKGIDWVMNIHDPEQFSEINRDLIRRALSELSPF